MVSSAHAITAEGVIVVASASASQIGPLASGAGRVIFVIGSQKIVPDLDEGNEANSEYVLRTRSREWSKPWVSTRSSPACCCFEREWQADRTTVVLVREPVGV